MPATLRRAAIIAIMAVAFCSKPQQAKVDNRRNFQQQVLVATDYGNDGILAYFPPNETELYKVIFSNACYSCVKAASKIKPAIVYETKLCNFQLTASGKIRRSPEKLSSVLYIGNVIAQPTLISCSKIE
jgi:hypothetical protein